MDPLVSEEGLEAAGKTFASFEEQSGSYPRWPASCASSREATPQAGCQRPGVRPPGTGKTHSVCALGRALVEAGHSVPFTPTYQLVQHLLAAKRDLELLKALRRNLERKTSQLERSLG